MPSTTSSSVSRLLASSTVITPSLPTFFIASARKRPISWSPLAEMVPTWAISSFDVTFFEFFFLGDGDAVLGDARCAERFVQHDVAALRAERHPHSVGEDVDAAQHLVARVNRESDFFSSHLLIF